MSEKAYWLKMTYPKRIKCNGCGKEKNVYSNIAKIEFSTQHSNHVLYSGKNIISVIA